MRRLTRERLTGLLRSRLTRLRGADGERGGIAVALALMMPLVFMAAALAIDTAGVWSARQQVENGADAAALAVAMDCANGNCGDIKSTAEAAFWANDNAAKASDLGPGEGWVAVNGPHVSITQKTDWVLNHYFAWAVGHSTGQLSVSSYAAWAPTTHARAAVPLAVSSCTYSGATSLGLGSGNPTTLPLATTGSDTCSQATAVTADTGGCTTTSTWNTTVAAGPATLPGTCTASYLGGLVGKNLVLPVWDTTSGSGYHVYGYAAFHVTGVSTASPPVLSGYFTVAARQTSDTTPPTATAPDLGARSVFLTTS